MRLSNFEINTIKSSAIDIFGHDSKIRLFGSRVDDTLKGGDIDLYIQPVEKNNLWEKKIRRSKNPQSFFPVAPHPCLKSSESLKLW